MTRASSGDRSVTSVWFLIPPELVRILAEHLEQFGAAEDGRLLHTSTGGTVCVTVWRCCGRCTRVASTATKRINHMIEKALTA
jgi:hypothetical protein